MFIVGTAARRAMRRHQGLPPPRGPRLPLWRLLLGEAAWALQELGREPLVLGALLLGWAGTIAVLGSTAPGPVLPWPGRILLALLAGLVVARGAWAWLRRRARSASRDGRAEVRPGVAATEVVAALAGLVLLGWLLVWLATLLA